MQMHWWQHAVIYQIYPRSFYDSSGDGIGDLQGIYHKLDYVAGLGVDAVWISPFYPSPMKDFGYDISDYCGVDPMFGTLEDFKAVLDKAHDLGLKVLIDQVWCHTADQHPWFVESRSDRTNPKADWYVWEDADETGEPPNNWLSTFHGRAWSWDETRQQFYLHHFLSEQPALNWYSPAVQQAMLDVGRFWLNLGVDGFRFDVVNFLMHDPKLRDNPPRTDADSLPAGGTLALPFFRYVSRYNIGQPQTYDMLRQIRATLDEYDSVTSLAEISCAEDAIAEATKAVGPERLHTAYNSALMTEEPLTPEHLRQVISEAKALLSQGGLCWTAGTHDFPRLASRWQKHLSHSVFEQETFNYMLAVLLLSLPGSCCLYQGDELGLPEAEVPFERMQDPFGIRNYPEFLGRDGCRTPMPWQAEVHQYGFTQSGESWLPVSESHKLMAVDQQDKSPHSLLTKYRQLLHWRRQQPAIGQSLTIDLIETKPELFGFVRGRDSEQPLLFLLNFSKSTVNQGLYELPPVKPLWGLPSSGARAFGHYVELPSYGVYIAAVDA